MRYGEKRLNYLDSVSPSPFPQCPPVTLRDRGGPGPRRWPEAVGTGGLFSSCSSGFLWEPAQSPGLVYLCCQSQRRKLLFLMARRVVGMRSLMPGERLGLNDSTESERRAGGTAPPSPSGRGRGGTRGTTGLRLQHGGALGSLSILAQPRATASASAKTRRGAAARGAVASRLRAQRQRSPSVSRRDRVDPHLLFGLTAPCIPPRRPLWRVSQDADLSYSG